MEREKEKYTKFCLFCGREFKAKRKDKKYCDKFCSNRARYKKNYVSKSKFVGKEIICPICKKDFIQKQPSHKYCSRKCYSILSKEKYRKISEGIIKESNGKYSNWLRLRFEIFKRDSFTCQYCGRNVRKDKIKIHTDHITPKSKGGEDIKSNLITSCNECNRGKGDVLLEQREIRMIKS